MNLRTNCLRKKIAIIATFFLILAILSQTVQAIVPPAVSSNQTILKEVPPPFDPSNPPPGTITMDQLLSTAQPSKEKISTQKVEVDIADAFTIPNDVKAKMSKEDLLALQCFPGYFTPKQTTLNQGYGMLRNNPQAIRTIICIDDDMWFTYVASFGPYWFQARWEGCCNWANNILEGGDDGLESPFGIDFQTDTANYCYWDTPDDQTYAQLLSAVSIVPPGGVGDDVMVVMSAQFGGYSEEGYEIVGMANTLGQHFIMRATADLPANLFQHEASHLFDCSDHDWDLTYCIMSYTYVLEYRGYCTGCTTQIDLNKYRFD